MHAHACHTTPQHRAYIATGLLGSLAVELLTDRCRNCLMLGFIIFPAHLGTTGQGAHSYLDRLYISNDIFIPLPFRILSLPPLLQGTSCTTKVQSENQSCAQTCAYETLSSYAGLLLRIFDLRPPIALLPCCLYFGAFDFGLERVELLNHRELTLSHGSGAL